LEFSYDYPFKTIFEGINLEIDKSWKTVLTGRNGRGKTTLLDLIAGKYKHYKGEILKNGEFSYFPYQVRNENLLVRELMKNMAGNFLEMEKLIQEYLLV